MRPIFLPDTAMGDDEAIVEEFYSFMSGRDGAGGIFGPVASTGADFDVYAALYYSGEVRNGGHQQFIFNSDNRSAILEAALSGLAEIGAGPQHGLLTEMKAWALANPVGVGLIMRGESPSHHRSGRPPALDRLDERFFDEQDLGAVEARAAAWIRACPDLRVIPEGEFMALVGGKAPLSEAPADAQGKIGLWDRVRMGLFGR